MLVRAAAGQVTAEIRIDGPVTTGGQTPPCGASGVITMPSEPGTSIWPPEASVYAVEPSGVPATTPSLCATNRSSRWSASLRRSDASGWLCADV